MHKLTKRFALIASLCFLTACGSNGAATGTANSVETTAILGDIQAIEWSPITTSNNICENQELASQIKAQIDAKADSPQHQALLLRFTQKLSQLEALVNSANANIDMEVDQEEAIESSNTCIDIILDIYTDMNIDGASTMYETLKSKVILKSKPSKPLEIEVIEEIETQEIEEIEIIEEVITSPSTTVTTACNGHGTKTSYKDFDRDGKGNPRVSIQACEIPEGYVKNKEDDNDFCINKRCYVNTNSNEKFCNNIKGCSFSGALANTQISRIHFDIEADTIEDITIRPSKSFKIDHSIYIYGCNQERSTETCEKDKQVRIDAKNMQDLGAMKSSTFFIKTPSTQEASVVKLQDLIIENNPVSAAIRVIHTKLYLNGRTLIQNNQGSIAGGMIIGGSYGTTRVWVNNESKLKMNSASNVNGAGAALLTNARITFNDTAKIRNNHAPNGTGGIRLDQDSRLIANDDSRFTKNTGKKGGAIMSVQGKVVLRDRVVVQKNTAQKGGAILTIGNGSVKLMSSDIRIVGNSTENPKFEDIHFQTKDGKTGKLVQI